jgi:RNAse (barnase) inhibitor barstar
MWIRPDQAAIEHEYKIEYLNHHASFGFESQEEFEQAVREAEVLSVNDDMDANIGGRSHCPTLDSLHSLISGYRSYPQYRNRDTLNALWDRIVEGHKTNMPMLLDWGNGRYTIMGGNTRADIAMMVYGRYDALVLKRVKK